MEKALTKFMKGRTRLAVVMMVCLVAIVALPAMAHAAAPFASEYPAPGTTVHGQPAVVSVDVLGTALNVKGATITIGSTVYPATVKQGLDAGSWASTDVMWADGYYHTVWRWTPVVGIPVAKATVYAYPTNLPVGAANVSASAKSAAGAVVGPDTWSFTVAAPIVIPPIPGADRTKFNAGCRSAGCHGVQFDADPAMGPDCTACHYDGFPKHGVKIVLAHLTVESEIAGNSGGCVACHGGNLQHVLAANWDGNGAASEHSYCSCHVYNEAAGKMACEDCHAQPMDAAAAHPYHVGAHDTLEAGIAGTKSSACVACHGTNIQDVSAGPMTQGEHKGCSCHARDEAEGASECADCHKGGEAAHGFANGLAHTGGGWIAASGHNTTTYGKLGAFEKFDGTDGTPKLTWKATQSFTVTSAKVAESLSVPIGTSFTAGQTGTVNSVWAFPTKSVFWTAPKVDVLNPSWTAGVYAAYYSDDSNVTLGVSPGPVTVISGRSAAPIKTGTADLSEGLLGFQPGNVPVARFASEEFTYSFLNKQGPNPVWVRVELNKGLAGDVTYQCVPSNVGIDTWVEADPGAASNWKLMDDNGNAVGSSMTLAQIAVAEAGKTVDRIYLTQGQGASYHNGTLGNTNGTLSYVDKVTVGSKVWGFSLASETPPAGAVVGLTKDSIVTCEDCHTGLSATGPHGESDGFGIDPNYPGDYSMAGLTKKVTSGVTMPSGAYSPSGIFESAPATSGATPLSRFAASAQWTDGTTGSSAVICAKCHKLMTVVPAGTTQGQSGSAWDVVVGSNTAHNSHHQDTTDGSDQCVSCHIAIPHGWKAPRLLVDVQEYENTPYVSENAIEDMGTIAALNNHPIVGADGVTAYSTSNGGAGTTNLSLAGTVLWDESQCDACGDHYGNDAFRPGTNFTPGPGQESAAVPVRIDF